MGEGAHLTTVSCGGGLPAETISIHAKYAVHTCNVCAGKYVSTYVQTYASCI